MNKLFSNTYFVSATALFCCALWGVSTPIIKIGYQFIDARSIPSLLFWVGLQFAFGGIITVLFYSIAKGRMVFPKKESVEGIVKISLLQTVLQYTFYYIGLLNTTAVKGTVLKGAEAFFSILVASVLFKQEKLILRKIFACVFGFTGLIIINLKGLELNFTPLGDGLVLLGVLVYSVSAVITKQYSKFENPIVISGYQMTVGGIMMVFIGVVFNGSVDFIGVLPITLILALIFALSYALWNMLIKYNPVSKLSLHSFTIPIFGVIFSDFLLHEQSDISPVNTVIALILISLGMIVGNLKK